MKQVSVVGSIEQAKRTYLKLSEQNQDTDSEVLAAARVTGDSAEGAATVVELLEVRGGQHLTE